MVGRVRFWLTVGVVCLLVVLVVPVMAQGGTPVQIGQNVTGSVSAEAPTARYSLAAAGGESVLVQVLALSPGFAPHLRVLNAAGVEILNLSNPDLKATLSSSTALSSAGLYTLEVSGENGSAGQFVLSLQAGAALPQPVTLILGQPLTAVVDGATPVKVYHFDTASIGAVSVSVESQSSGAGPLVTLYDESLGKAIASADAGVIGTVYALPAVGHAYRVEVRAGDTGAASYVICLGSCGSTGSAQGSPLPTQPATVPVTPVPAGSTVCTATSSAGGAVNLRSGPGTVYAILGALPLGQTAQVIGLWTGGSWYQITFGGQTLWLAGSVVSMSGDCSGLPLVAAPANAPLAPTATPTATFTPAATNTPEATAMPTATNTPEPLPDLAVVGMSIVQDSTTHARVTFDVYNRGTVDVTQPFYVYVCITTLCVEKQVTLPVRAGSATEVFVDLNHQSSTTPETVAIAVDSRGEFRELSEDNNVTSLSDVSLNF